MPRFRNTRSDNAYQPYHPSTDQRTKEHGDPFSMSGLPTPISSSKSKSKERHSRLLKRKHRPPPLHLPPSDASSTLPFVQGAPSIDAGPGPSRNGQATAGPSGLNSHTPQASQTPGSADLSFGYFLPSLPQFNLLSPSGSPPVITGLKSPPLRLPSPPASPAGSGMVVPRQDFSHGTFAAPSTAGEKRSVHFPPDELLRAESPVPVASSSAFTAALTTTSDAGVDTGFLQSPFCTPEKRNRTKGKRSERVRADDSLKITVRRAARTPSHPYAPATPRFRTSPFIGPSIRHENDIQEGMHSMTRSSETPKKKKKRSRMIPRAVEYAPRSPSPPSRHSAVQLPHIVPYSQARTVAERLFGSNGAPSEGDRSARRRAREERRLRGVGGHYRLDRAKAYTSSGQEQQSTSSYRHYLYQSRHLSHSSLRYQTRFDDLTGTMSISEAMDVDTISREARAGPEVSPLYNMFAGAFATIPKPPPNAEHIPSFAYPSAHDLPSPSFFSSAESSIAPGYRGRPIPCLSDSAYYVPTYTFTDMARPSSTSPVEVDFPPLCASSSASQTEETDADKDPATPFTSPQLSPMLISPPTVLESIRQVPTPERSPVRRHLRRIVPKPHSIDSMQVSSLHSPPLEYPYPYSATDRPYNVLLGGEEGSLIEQLGLMSMSVISLAARR